MKKRPIFMPRTGNFPGPLFQQWGGGKLIKGMGNWVGVGKPGAGPSFDPRDLANLILWLDGADPSTMFQDVGKTTPVTIAGQSVAVWEDKSGNGNDWAQSTVALRPAYSEIFNTSYPAVYFNSDYLIGSMSEVAGDWSVYCVMSANSDANASYMFDFQTGRFIVGNSIDTAKPQRWGYFDTVWHLEANTGDSNASLPSQFSTILGVTSGGKVYHNGNLQFSSTYAARAMGGTQAIGARYSGTNSMIGYIADLLIYSGAHSDADRQLVEAYLAAKHGL